MCGVSWCVLDTLTIRSVICSHWPGHSCGREGPNENDNETWSLIGAAHSLNDKARVPRRAR